MSFMWKIFLGYRMTTFDFQENWVNFGNIGLLLNKLFSIYPVLMNVGLFQVTFQNKKYIMYNRSLEKNSSYSFKLGRILVCWRENKPQKESELLKYSTLSAGNCGLDLCLGDTVKNRHC